MKPLYVSGDSVVYVIIPAGFVIKSRLQIGTGLLVHDKAQLCGPDQFNGIDALRIYRFVTSGRCAAARDGGNYRQ